jgi:polyribonucleotide nucleotidyltransferase
MAVHRVQGAVGGRDLFFETGKLARQAGGATVVGLGETQVLVTATAGKNPKEQLDFFPLTVDVEERMYAAGKIPGGFFRREGRPSETAILTARLVDRPLRPSFPKGLRNEIHVVATILSADMENNPDVLAINGASMAVLLAGIPFSGPVGAVRLGRRGGEWLVNPTFAEIEECTFDMVVAGRQNESGGVDILMVEAEATENAIPQMEEGAPKPTEEAIGLALELAKSHIATACELQRELLRQAEVSPREFPLFTEYGEDIAEAVRRVAEDGTREAITIADKADRDARMDEIKADTLQRVAEQLGESFAGREREVSASFRSLTKELVRQRIVKEGKRIDGRGPRDIRPLSAEVGILPRAHGSGLFQRGETQVLNVTTLGMVRMEQMIDTLDPEDRKRYMHHYNFPPFSTGETGFMRGPKRREIGHGALAERALLPVIPSRDEFPYALRLVSEVLSSNGSTSMASVCGSTLSLMDAGVPIKAPVGGIAMGLVAEGGEYVTLTDILGAEDAFGDMDFKVAGTREFVTALQLDTKLAGIPSEVLIGALTQARDARMVILDVIQAAIEQPRQQVSMLAPRVHIEQIPVAKIGELIGPKGKRINEIQAASGADISIEDDGRVFIGATSGDQLEIALKMIREQMNPVMPQVGERYLGTVVKTTTFGAFISLTPGKDGLLHISKLGKKGQRVRAVEDVVNVGDKLLVEVTEVDRQGRISLKLAEEDQAETAQAGATSGGSAEDVAAGDGEGSR